ncbi:type I polyketide synthase [Cellulomonas shaoxiangyii]|uniref:SDR family NAD(P)-dependent oxidoreductase n=1 Tax=Cellulomonas shaoxiangyii TaxID=2566013 RepID=A0A4P7SPT1_9CELL|nr:type I polyketide synthase [Cellulomonas shaoxiangyii]QCB95014.1 SDR family NAD(P)-dependent oxidoreductase [Cellulomonas shaoxiangyii]TGY86343.1 SDR family NAD(P)-dependent oxidoreductase [Cellulomonas shaoxiangyii]
MDIAIIGLAVDVPGAGDPQALWDLVTAGGSTSRPFPAQRRQDVDEFVRYRDRASLGQEPDAGAPEYHRAGYLDRIDLLDHEFFGMTPAQAAVADPHQRLVLRTTYRALEDAGYVGPRVRGSRTGVFVGFAANPGQDYAHYWSTVDPSLNQLGITGSIPTMLANRISFLLDLQGPSMVVDSACSASLVAVHLARTALLADDCDQAVVAGARIMLLPVQRASTRIGIESSDGETRTFDASADGTGMGEGSGALVLKRLDRALADRDQVLAVIKGSGVNHDGASQSMTGPDAASQARLLTSTWQRSGVDPRTLGYVEVHGTATRVGDPVEVDGLTRAFRTVTDERGFCAVGTVKTTIGHLFEGSGVLGMIKAVQGLRNRQIAPLSYLREPNPAIAFEDSPVRLPTELEPWPLRDGVRRGAVSAFGLGGTNAHVVLEEWVGDAEVPAGPGGTGYLFTVSARTDRSLRLVLRALHERLARGDLDGRTADVCYTSNVSRSHHGRRAGFVVRDVGELRAALAAALAGEPAPGPAVPGEREVRLDRLRAAWVEGADVDLLDQFEDHPGPGPRTVSLVPYVFDETRAWVTFPSDWHARGLGDAGAAAQSGAYAVEFVPTDADAVDADGAVPPSASVVALVDADAAHGAGARLAAALPGVHLLELSGTDADAADRMAAVVDQVVAGDHTHLVFALGFEPARAADVAELDHRVEKNLVGLFLLAKALMERTSRLSLVVLTRRALAVHPGRGDAVAENAALAGLAKTLGQEYPALNVRMVDVDDATAGHVLGRELCRGVAGVVALREGVVYAEQFSEVAELAPPDGADALEPVQGRPGGAYLITGGTGGLGLAIARRLAVQAPGAHLYLTGRSAPPPPEDWEHLAYSPSARSGDPVAERARALLELVELGADVRVESGDAGDAGHLTDLVGRIRAEHGRLDGVVHAAGVPGENLIMFRAVADFRRVIRPKMRGAFLLHELTRDDPPDFVVHMSSAAAVFPSMGQGDYAAANYYLDTLAMSAPEGAGRVLAIDWVAWRDTGMAVATGANEDGVFRALRTPEALDLLFDGLRSDRRRFLAGRIDYSNELTAILPTHRMALSPGIATRIDEAVAASADRMEQIAARARAAIDAVEVDLVGRPGGGYSDVELSVARCLAYATGSRTVPVDADLRDLGIDSLAVVTVTSNLSSALGVDLDPVDLLGAASVEEIAAVVESRRFEFADQGLLG